ncbi:MAG: InlB B-repeat-containing protein [Treponema sp.]|jgi:uncharacterized repeat protein (TIGR02543 family)|nr:InlB B-repeat-containing protein [Treponema sp.]
MGKKILSIFMAVFAGLFAANCGLDPFFIPVEFIDGVPETGDTGIPLTLTGTVNPDFASNRSIVWSVISEGGTEASIERNILHTAKDGTVVIRAKVAKATINEKDYVQDFNVVFSSPVPTYMVRFEPNGGSAVGSQAVSEGGTAKRPDDPGKSGFGFVDWYDNAALNEPPYDFERPVTENITLYAKWKGITALAVKSQPATLAYTHGDALDLSGLTVTLTYDDDTTEDAAFADFAVKNIYTNPAHGATLSHSVHDGKPVIVSAGSLTADTDKLTVNNRTPAAADYTIGNLNQDEGSVSAVTITAKGDAPAASSIRYDNSPNVPTAAGTYTVAFDVSAADGWNAAAGLIAGTLTVKAVNGTVTITLSMEAITEGTAGESLLSPIKISRGAGSPADVTATITITGSYDSIKWEIDGVGAYFGQTVTGNGPSFMLSGNDNKYNTLGGHVVRLTVEKDGKTYMVNIPFTVVD